MNPGLGFSSYVKIQGKLVLTRFSIMDISNSSFLFIHRLIFDSGVYPRQAPSRLRAYQSELATETRKKDEYGNINSHQIKSANVARLPRHNGKSIGVCEN